MTGDESTALIQDEGGHHRYFTIVPNLIFDDHRIDPLAGWLYSYYKRVAGDKGRCYQSNATVAANVRMNRATVIRKRDELAGLGYISVDESPGHPSTIRVLDRWDDNARAALKRGGVAQDDTSGGEGVSQEATGGVAGSDGGVAQDDTKKNQLKITEEESPSRDSVGTSTREGAVRSTDVAREAPTPARALPSLSSIIERRQRARR